MVGGVEYLYLRCLFEMKSNQSQARIVSHIFLSNEGEKYAGKFAPLQSVFGYFELPTYFLYILAYYSNFLLFILTTLVEELFSISRFQIEFTLFIFSFFSFL